MKRRLMKKFVQNIIIRLKFLIIVVFILILKMTKSTQTPLRGWP